MSSILQEINKRILVLDGAMGTMLQRYNFSEDDFRALEEVVNATRKPLPPVWN